MSTDNTSTEFTTAALCDNHPNDAYVVTPLFRDYGAKRTFFGRIATVEVFEDNLLMRSMLEENGAGRVLVVDGGGSLRCALLDAQLAALAFRNGWGGLLIYGCVRDSRLLSQVPMGIKALNTHALRASNAGAGAKNVLVTFADTRFIPGYFIYADEDAIVVAEYRLM